MEEIPPGRIGKFLKSKESDPSEDALSLYDYDLPEDLIAVRPPPRRENARMLVLDRKTGAITHRTVADLPSLLRPDDLLVFNDSKVVPARLLSDEGRTEVFLLEKLAPLRWRCLVRPGKRFHVGNEGLIAGASYRVLEVEPEGTRILQFNHPPDLTIHGKIPLPPYIKRESDAGDRERYQTVFAREEGSVAAPTAGLHFTPELLARLPHTFVTLHIGLGTFAPVKTRRLSEHTMHTESYMIPETAARAINAARRIVAVGTTSVRVLESQPPGPLKPASGSTRLFIRPPHHFQRTGALLTNFHLPQSTLLVLVSAFADRKLILSAYAEAVRQRYRFFSYGDCMLII